MNLMFLVQLIESPIALLTFYDQCFIGTFKRKLETPNSVKKTLILLPKYCPNHTNQIIEGLGKEKEIRY